MNTTLGLVFRNDVDINIIFLRTMLGYSKYRYTYKWIIELAYGMLNLQSYKSEVRLKGREYKKQAFINIHCPISLGFESMTTHRQSTGRHDNSATALFHRQPTRRHDHWPTRQVTDIFFKNSPTLADTHRHSPTETFLEKG